MVLAAKLSSAYIKALQEVSEPWPIDTRRFRLDPLPLVLRVDNPIRQAVFFIHLDTLASSSCRAVLGSLSGISTTVARTETAPP